MIYKEKKSIYNILFVEAGLGAGGSSNFLWYFLKYIDKKTFNPLVLFYKFTNGPDIKKIKDLGIEVLFLNFNIDGSQNKRDIISSSANNYKVSKDSKSVFLIKKISRILGIKPFLKFFYELFFNHIPQAIRLRPLLKNRNIDLVFLNNDLHYHISSVIAKAWTGIPCICRKAGIGGGRILKMIFHPFVDLFIASSEGALRDYKNEKLPEEKLRLIYEGVDLLRFNHLMNGKAKRQEFNIPIDAILVGSIARIAPGKGQFELVDAAPYILKKCPKVRFVIVGDDVEGNGRLLHELKAKAELLGVSPYCSFTGWRTDIPDLLDAIDIFVHNPNGWLEALGITTLEAMAMAKPTVVTNNWGLSETTENGITGYVIPPYDKDSLVNAITELASDSEKINRMGKKARERAEALFDIRKNVEKTEEIILSILKTIR